MLRKNEFNYIEDVIKDKTILEHIKNKYENKKK